MFQRLKSLGSSLSLSNNSNSTKSMTQEDQVAELIQRLGGPGGEVDKLLNKGGETTLGTEVALRFLRAEKFDLDKAEVRLQDFAKWRADVCPLRSIRESEITSALADEKVYFQGHDKEGHPLIVIVGNKHFAAKRDLEEGKLFACYVLDVAIASIDKSLNSDGKVSVIVDLRDIVLANLDAPILRACFAIIQQYYPERLHAVWFYEAPLIFWGCWKLVTPFIDPVSKEKIKFVYEKDASEILLGFESKNLPREYGGLMDLKLVQHHGLPPVQVADGAGPLRHHISTPEVDAAELDRLEHVNLEGSQPAAATQATKA